LPRSGADVTTVRVGQKVVLAPGVTCGKCAACFAGQDNHCRYFTNLGYLIDGGCAEFVRAPEVNCLSYPEKPTFEEAASIPLVSPNRLAHASCASRVANPARMFLSLAPVAA